MWQTLITFFIVGLAVFFTGRKLFFQFRKAIDPSQNVACGCCSSCNTCSETDCTTTRNK